MSICLHQFVLKPLLGNDTWCSAALQVLQSKLCFICKLCVGLVFILTFKVV